MTRSMHYALLAMSATNKEDYSHYRAVSAMYRRLEAQKRESAPAGNGTLKEGT